MKIEHAFPPNWEDIKAVLNVDADHTIFTYGDTIYNPGGFRVDEALLAHEMVHQSQQNGLGEDGPAKWWDRFLKDPKWRLEQEIEAYRVQWREAQKGITDRNAKAAYLRQISGIIAGPTYGNLLTPAEAMRLLTQ